MSFYYVELDKKANILSFGDATDMNTALKTTKGTVKEITQKEYQLVSACRGDLNKGINQLKQLKKQIHDTMLDWDDEELDFRQELNN